jgi:hypothetical protein
MLKETPNSNFVLLDSLALYICIYIGSLWPLRLISYNDFYRHSCYEMRA